MTPTPELDLPQLRRALAGRYEIEAPIARGGMGAVYRARDLALDRAVAIKALPPAAAADADIRVRFLHEARTVAALSHPNIVPIFAVEATDSVVYFAMAYVGGATLADRVARQGPLTPLAAARVIREVGEALAYAHARGVVHRDVKPDNILLDDATGRAMLSDFGIAHASPSGRPAAPRGPVIGTAGFMSPEQARGAVVDARSDIYSLGVAAFYALSGLLPFHAPSDDMLVAMHAAGGLPPMRQLPPDVPASLARVIERCLAREPWARFPNAGALVRAVVAAVEPPPAPLPVRAFLVQSDHLVGPALAHAAVTGLVLMPLAAWSWLHTADPRGRAASAVALGVALVWPAVVAVVRARRLLEAGVKRGELIEVLEMDRARRLEELAFAYGPGPSALERVMQGLAWVAVVVTASAVALLDADVPPAVTALLPSIVTIGGAAGLGAAILARAGTEQRTDPRGEGRLRFWRSRVGRLVFRCAALLRRSTPPIATILGRHQTPA